MARASDPPPPDRPPFPEDDLLQCPAPVALSLASTLLSMMLSERPVS